MAVRDKKFMMEIIKNHIGDKTDDESLKILEDFTDTINDMESKAQPDGEDWKTKYEELDATWRKKYTDRFFNADAQDQGGDLPEEPEEPVKREYNSLFSDGSGNK